MFKKQKEIDSRLTESQGHGEVWLLDEAKINKHSLLNVAKNTILNLFNENLKFDYQKKALCKNLLYALIANQEKENKKTTF